MSHLRPDADSPLVGRLARKLTLHPV